MEIKWLEIIHDGMCELINVENPEIQDLISETGWLTIVMEDSPENRAFVEEGESVLLIEK